MTPRPASSTAKTKPKGKPIHVATELAREEWDFSNVSDKDALAVCWWEYAREAYQKEREAFDPANPGKVALPVLSTVQAFDFLRSKGEPALSPDLKITDQAWSFGLSVRYGDVRPFLSSTFAQADYRSTTGDPLIVALNALLLAKAIEKQAGGVAEGAKPNHLKGIREAPATLILLGEVDRPAPARDFHPATAQADPFPASYEAALEWLAVHRLRSHGLDWEDVGQRLKTKAKGADGRDLGKRQKYAEALIAWLRTGDRTHLSKLPASVMAQVRQNKTPRD